MIGGLVWKALQAARGNRDAMRAALDVFNYTAGQVPGVTPVLTAGSDLTQFATGQNVYDPFRNQFLFTDDEYKAGGWQATKKFLGYEFQQLGGGIVWKFYPGGTRPRERTTGQVLLDLPIVSNILGRWIKITNFGETERLRETVADVQADEARQRLTERAGLNDAIREYQALPTAERTTAKAQALAGALAAQSMRPDQTGAEQQAAVRALLTKFRMGLVRGEADPVVDAVMSATSNAQKAAVILKAAEHWSNAELGRWIAQARQEGVVSEAVQDAVARGHAATAP